MRRMSNTRFNSSRSRTTHLMSKVSAIVLVIVGILMSIPFVWVMLFGAHQPNISIGRIIAVIMIIFALPMFGFGFIGLFARRNSGTDTVTSDMSRIRFTVETDSMRRK
jgi:hypothetical protein